ncbi:MAG: hypothetical protein HY735_18000 [Verrucomicrobia bacterium]|nr:hypothetical protein [Verrucomicrobiota bacterium]
MKDSVPSISRKRTVSTTRREFLINTAGLAAGAAALNRPSSAAQTASASRDLLLPTIRLGPHQVTRLILGGNPIYGFSHFNKLLSEHQKAWHTPERVVELLSHCETKGLNAFQNSYRERTLSDLAKYRAAGGTMHWLCLGNPDWDQKPHLIEETAKRKPIGIAPHGSLGDRLYREKKLNVLTGLLKRIRDTGVLVGVSAHNPALVELAEEKGWDVDYYMCCLYYRTRTREEYVKLLGPDLPLGEIYLPSDPPRMFKVVQQTRKPCLVYKVLAAGRRISTPSEVRRCFETALSNIKPGDALIVGMYQEFGDQVGENAEIVRDICAKGAGRSG